MNGEKTSQSSERHIKAALGLGALGKQCIGGSLGIDLVLSLSAFILYILTLFGICAGAKFAHA